MDAQPDGSGFEPSAPRTRARPLSLQSTGDGEVETKCVRVEIATYCKCVRFDDSVQSEGEGQGTAVGFQPLPAVDVGERRSGEEGGATGKGDGENQDDTAGFQPSPAEAGDGQGAEGKGDRVGNGEPAGFEPSPADAGKKKGGEGQGDGERQGNPTGFEPSPADVGKKKGGEGQGDGEAYHPDGVWGPPVPHDGPLEGVWARTRTWRDPSPRKESVGLAAAKDRSARGSDPAASRDPSDVGPTLDPAVTARPGLAGHVRTTLGGLHLARAGPTLAPIPPHVIAAKATRPSRPRTPRPRAWRRRLRKWKRRSRRWVTTSFWL